MRITTWNVNGLRAALKKGLMEWVENDPPEALCLQEVRARPEQLDAQALERLRAVYPWMIWNPAERPGYSGVAVFTNQPALEVGYGLGSPRFDAEGRVVWLRYPGFTLLNVYFPSAARALERLPFKLDFYAHLLEFCTALHENGQQLILTGDFNIAHNEIDLKNPKANERNTGFLPEERAWIDRYLAHGFVDSYRSLYPERAQYTWWTFMANARSRGIGWRLDYFLVSKPLHAQVQDVMIMDEVRGSDHCPVMLKLRG
ncbi:MAG: exodeoxyribonuclease III [Anaerolineae bacterium UTCFX2]|jgi:exodeoxyribonuclease-3|nr:exodeoxyribonuclease III [Anaerolineales bacterium]OQY90134.1 MAG: exodeoxyribonuclease III [Anaerolineae bacterium UTCFX2]